MLTTCTLSLVTSKLRLNYVNQYDAASEAGLIGGSSGNSSSGSREHSAFYGEVVIPLLPGLDSTYQLDQLITATSVQKQLQPSVVATSGQDSPSELV